MYGGEYRQRDQVVEEYESFEDGIEVLCLAKALEKYPWIREPAPMPSRVGDMIILHPLPRVNEITRAVAKNDKTVGVCAWREV